MLRMSNSPVRNLLVVDSNKFRYPEDPPPTEYGTYADYGR